MTIFGPAPESKDVKCPDCGNIFRKMSGNHLRCGECQKLHGKRLAKIWKAKKILEKEILEPPKPAPPPPIPRETLTPAKHLEDRFVQIEQKINLVFNRLQIMEQIVGISWRYETGRSHIDRDPPEKIPAPASKKNPRQIPGSPV